MTTGEKSAICRIKDFCNRRGVSLPPWKKSCVWALGLTLFFALAIKEICPLVSEYVHNNVGTQTRIISQHTTAKPPLLTVCLPWNSWSLRKIIAHMEATQSQSGNATSPCTVCDGLASRSWDVWEGMSLRSVSLEENQRSLAERFVAQLLTQSDDNFRLLGTDNYGWNGAIIDSVWELFYCIRKFDINLLAQSRRQWCFEDAKVNQLLSDKKRIDALYTRIINVLCEYIEIRGDQSDSSQDSCSVILSRAPSAFHEDQFCFALMLSVHNFSTVYVKAKPASRYGPKLSDGANSGWSLYSNIDYLCLETGKNYISFPIYVSEQRPDLVHIGYAVSGTAIDKLNLDCYHDKSPAVCRSNCMIDVINRMCGCEPFMFRSRYGAPFNLAYCNSSNYNECRLDKETEIGQCEGKCLFQCTQTNYEYSVVRQGQNAGRLINRPKQEYLQFKAGQTPEFYMVIYPLSKIYMEFSIIPRNTWEQFMSQVGAVVNLYLGVSGISLIAWGIFLGKMAHRCFSSIRSNRGQETPGMRSVTNDANHRTELGVIESFRPMYTFGISQQASQAGNAETWSAAMEARFAELEQKMEQLQSQKW